MITSEQNMQFEKILAREKLLTFPSEDKVCDEVPLYSRYKQIEKLGKMPLVQTNKTLLALSLKFLEKVIADSAHDEPLFAAITVRQGESDDDPIVPRIFFCNCDVNILVKKLSLYSGKGAFSETIRQLLSKANQEKYSVLEDTDTSPSDTRVFIGPRTAPFSGFVELSTFAK